MSIDQYKAKITERVGSNGMRGITGEELKEVFMAGADAMQEVQEQTKVGINLGFLTPTSAAAPATGIHRGQAAEAGTYVNFGGIVVTSAELLANFVFIEVTNGVAKKVLSAKPVADPSKHLLYSVIKNANIASETEFIDDLNGYVLYRVKTGQTLLTTDIPANVVGTKVDIIGTSITSVNPNTPNTNLLTGNIQANKGIIYANSHLYGADTNYDSAVIPLEKNTRYDFSGYVRGAAGAFGLFSFDGTNYTRIPDADAYLFGWLDKAKTLLLVADMPSTAFGGSFVSPNIDNVYLIINTRYQAASNITNFSIWKYKAVELVPISKINNIDFNNAVVDAFLKKSTFTTSKNLFNPTKIFSGWGNVAGIYTGITVSPTSKYYKSTAIKLEKNTIYTISGDTVATGAPLSAQNYSFSKYDTTTKRYIPFTDVELASYTRLDGVSTDKAWFKSVNTSSKTIKTPNPTEDVYLILNTDYNAVNNTSTLQIEKGTSATAYIPYSEKVVVNAFGFPMSHPESSGTTSSGLTNQWQNKTAYFFGDSTMTQALANEVKTNLGLLSAVSYNVSGASSNTVYATISGTGGYTKPNYSTCDAVVIYTGHNNDADGSAASVEGLTPENYLPDMWGYLGKSIEFIWAENPNIRIYICTQHLTNRDSYQQSKKKAVVLTAISEYYAVPLIDVMRNCGINKKNLVTYAPDLTHQNAAGAVKIAKAMSLGMSSK